jgi:uncharacterized protein with FMN-binding domain
VTRSKLIIPSTIAGLVAVLGVQHVTGTQATAVVVPTATTTGSTSTAGSAGSGSTAGNPAGGSSSGTTQTAVGQDVVTQYGDVQLKVTVKGGKIQSIDFVALNANDGRSQQIDQYAAPLLNQQAIAASSANIQGVSGATYTSEAYKQSLQSALDQLPS